MIRINEIKDVSRAVVAAVFRVHPTLVNKWVEKGCPRNDDRSYDISEVVAWRLDELALVNKANNENADPESAKWLTAFRRERAIMAKIERKKLEGELFPKKEVYREWALRLKVLFSGFEIWKNRLSLRLEKKTRNEITEILTDEIYLLRKTFAEQGRYCPEIHGEPRV